MECLSITATQSHRADVLGIKRLPPHRHLRLLRVIPGVHRWPTWEDSRRQHPRGVLAVPFLALGKVHLKAVEAREVPRGAGEWHTHFLVDCPDVPVHTEALSVRGANR